ncbi:Glutamyl-tRNA(Gln) amidotransferase subunit A [anaerobic digester metagenome]
MQKNKSFIILILLALGVSVGINLYHWNRNSTFQYKIEIAETLLDLDFNISERDSMVDGLKEARKKYKAIHKYELPNSVAPTLVFSPVPVGYNTPQQQYENVYNLPTEVIVPQNREELCFYSIGELAMLIKQQKITSTELTQLYINRLKKYDPELHCVVTLLEDRALEQAAKADQEIANGQYRGPLHGIPYGVKDLLALKGEPFTWGSPIYKDQIADITSPVIEKLDKAGAVLVVKLSLGEFAMGDVWYGGKTRNPWNTELGSSGSSAGSAAATSAGLVAFAIGSETWGSIVSPSTVCGVTGLRPTFGRVSRTGAMALSWSMDKIGPICRTAQDCAIVLQTIQGPDGMDRSLQNIPFNYNANKPLSSLRVGYLKHLFDEEYEGKTTDSLALNALKELGITPIPLTLPSNVPVDALTIILEAEAAAAFSNITLSNQDDKMVEQHMWAWPNIFRMARFIPATEYIQANRIRQHLIDELTKLFVDVDVIIAPSFGGDQLLMTNLTGHPAVLVPNGFTQENLPTSFTFIANWYNEADLILLADAYQQKTQFNKKHPEKFLPVN